MIGIRLIRQSVGFGFESKKRLNYGLTNSSSRERGREREKETASFPFTATIVNLSTEAQTKEIKSTR